MERERNGRDKKRVIGESTIKMKTEKERDSDREKKRGEGGTE